MQRQPFGDYHYVQGVCFLLTLLTLLRTLTVGDSHISKQHFRTHSVLLPIYCLFGSNLVTSDALIINKCMFLWKDDFSRSKWKPCRLQIHTIQLSDEPV